MSKFARKPIALDSVTVEITDNQVKYKGKLDSGTYDLPEFLIIKKEDNTLLVQINEKFAKRKDLFAQWGLHRALLGNLLKGAATGFERQIKIEGLGFKAQAQGSLLTFSLGFSHKKTYELPKGVTIEIDKTGQLLTLKSSKKDILGHACSCIRDLRPPEPYKGTGIRYADEVIRRKAGKANSK